MIKTKVVKIEKSGRDFGKSFLITEMPCEQAENWAMRVFFAAAKSGVDLPDNIQEMGMAGFLITSLKAVFAIDWTVAKPLLDEMMGCVKVWSKLVPQGRELTAEDIEEVSTRLFLRKEVIELHLGFSFAELTSDSQSSAHQPQVIATSPITKMLAR